MKILVCINSTWNFFNFRSNLIRAFILNGHEVIAVAPPDKYVDDVIKLGCQYIPFFMDNKGKNPFKDFLLLIRFIILFIKVKPDVYLSFTIKPNLYGSIAAHLCKIPVINNIAGLGYIFAKNNYLTKLVIFLYKIALFKSDKVFFQNIEDQYYFIQNKIVKSDKTERLPGSGIDLSKFQYKELIIKDNKIIFLLISRMIWDKGIGEFVEAAKIILSKHKNIEFKLLGFLDVNNPNAINKFQMDRWNSDGFIQYLGETDDVRPYIEAATVIVLPSYYKEGVPRCLLEAAAIGRPIITSDTVGCRETIVDGKSGLLVKPKDINHLVKNIEILLEFNINKLTDMGRNGRELMKILFDENLIIDSYLNNLYKFNKK